MIYCDNERCVNIRRDVDGTTVCIQPNISLITTHKDMKDWIMVCTQFEQSGDDVIKPRCKWEIEPGLFKGQIKYKERT
jgi:hypothetical protein